MRIRNIMCIIALLLLTGCGKGNDADVYKKQVINLVDSNIEEEFNYVSSEVVNAKEGRYKYYFNSSERNLKIEVESYLSNDKRLFVTNYLEAIEEYYSAQILVYLRDNLEYFDEASQTITVNSWEELDKVIECLYYCENLYAQENQFQEPYFTLENSIMNISLVNGSGTIVATYSVSGYFTQDEIAYDLYTVFEAEGIE